MTLKKQVHEATLDFLMPLEWDVSGGEPHVTIGHIMKGFGRAESILSQENKNIKSSVEAIQVSICGIRGSCLGVLKTFEINNEPVSI